MTFLQRHDLPAQSTLSPEHQRAYEYYQPIGKFTKCEFELDCIDCHTAKEVMGDGTLHNNKGEAQYIQCQTCHGTRDSLPSQVSIQQAFSQVTPSAPISSSASAVMISQQGDVFPNIQLINGKWTLTTQVGGASYMIPMVKS